MSLKVIKLSVGQLHTNCYLIYDSKTLEAIIIDPGDDADYIAKKITDLELIPQKIIATHGHFDHILAAYELQTMFNIPFVVHKKDEFLVKNMQSSAKYFLHVGTDPSPKVDDYLKEDDIIEIGRHKLKVIETPGHTPGGITLYSKKENIAFVGDSVFERGGVGRTDFSYSDQVELHKSIRKIFTLPDETKYFAGHGESFTKQR